MKTQTIDIHRMETESEHQISITPPCVNLNGTMAESLLDQHRDVLTAVDALRKALGSARPHGRDYQTDRTKTLYEQAETEFAREIDHLNEMETRHRTICNMIYEQMTS